MESLAFNQWLPVLIILSPMITGLVILCLDEERIILRRALNLGGNLLCVALIAILVAGVYQGESFETRLPLLPDIDLVLHADALSLLFVSLSGLLWFLTTLYAIGYLEGTKNRSRFFGFFSLCVSATLGIALAGNLITFVIFYELLTLTTYPLVVHKGNKASLHAGRVYLTYTMIGGALLLGGVVWLKAVAGSLDFTATGVLSQMQGLDPLHLKIIFGLLIAGLGVKAALVPLHGWLPVAMAAPAPVSALLHAVAVVKAGAFGIVRVVYDVYGIEFARDLGLTLALGGIAAFTIIYGSVRAVFQDDIKKRLAYSTVSQVSYIALGTAIAGPIATIGGMVHLVHQGLMKITLFFCAGNLAETLGVHKVSEMNGVGRRMPLTMGAFTIAALGMIGVPPIAGFVSKWYLGAGALEVGAYWVLLVLAGSSLLNAIYFLPVLYAAWFKPVRPEWASTKKTEIGITHWMLLLPPLVTATLAVAAGVFASATLSPVSWAKLIAAREYGQEMVHWALSTQLELVQLIGIIAVPLLLALSMIVRPWRRWLTRLTPWAALPALAVALLASAGEVTISWLFFGSVFSLGPETQVVLLLAATLWFAAGLYGQDYLRDDPHLTRYCLFFLLSMAGSFGLILAQDIFGFITFFSLMSLSAYGLVIHSGSEAALKAGRSYIQWVVIGELLLFAALVGLAATGNGDFSANIDKFSQPLWVTVLLLFGFGIKAGLLTVHVWLPQAHPVAPVPASALLSGLMVKAGLLGWWRFLPLGEVAIPEIGSLMIALGLAGAFIAVIFGLLQQNPKALLAYSTISQMGILAAGIGIGLLKPVLWPVLAPALLLYVLHHGFAKSALFLSIGLAQINPTSTSHRWLLWLGVALPALALAGLPFTSGALAKFALKDSIAELTTLALLFSLTAVGTTCLMLRFLQIMHKLSNATKLSSAKKQAPTIGLIGLFAFALPVLAIVLLVPQLSLAEPYSDRLVSIASLWKALWPMLAGGVLFLLLQPLFKKTTATEQTPAMVEKLFAQLGQSLGLAASHIGSRYAKLSSLNADASKKLHASVNAEATSSHGGLHPGLIFLIIFVIIAMALGLGR